MDSIRRYSYTKEAIKQDAKNQNQWQNKHQKNKTKQTSKGEETIWKERIVKRNTVGNKETQSGRGRPRRWDITH